MSVHATSPYAAAQASPWQRPFGWSPTKVSTEHEIARLGDGVSTEIVEDHLYIEGETDAYPFRLFFRVFAEVLLSAEDSRKLILEITRRL